MEKNKSERSIGWLVEEIMKGSVEKNRNRQEQELIRRGEFRDRTERLVRNLMVEELDRARKEVIKNLIKKIEEANCDSISLELLREIDLSKLTTK